MIFPYANDFAEIPVALAGNQPLRDAVVSLIAVQPMAGKVTEGSSRLEAIRGILHQLAMGSTNIHQAIRQVEIDLPRTGSVHAANNRVFPDGWAERLVRTQFSRFYNQAVLEQLAARGDVDCFVPHSSSEQMSSQCSQLLAGRTHRIQALLSLLNDSYGLGQFSKTPKIPDHPHCTHVVRPVQPIAMPDAAVDGRASSHGI